jgi:putative addiction module CopG family antidote
MQLAVPQDVQQFIDEAVKSGRFSTPQDVVLAALQRMRQDMETDFEEGELDSLIEEGEADIAAGRVLDEDEVFQRLRAKSEAYRGNEGSRR